MNKAERETLVIVDVNGDEREEEYNKGITCYGGLTYKDYLEILENKIRECYEAGWEIIYTPNCSYKDLEESISTKKSEYHKKLPQLKKHFPFLERLTDIEMTVFSSWATHSVEIQRAMANTHNKTVNVCGNYLFWCVRETANSIQEICSDAAVKIVQNYSFDNGGRPQSAMDKNLRVISLYTKPL